jgi:hypothetical protein
MGKAISIMLMKPPPGDSGWGAGSPATRSASADITENSMAGYLSHGRRAAKK